MCCDVDDDVMLHTHQYNSILLMMRNFNLSMYRLQYRLGAIRCVTHAHTHNTLTQQKKAGRTAAATATRTLRCAGAVLMMMLMLCCDLVLTRKVDYKKK